MAARSVLVSARASAAVNGGYQPVSGGSQVTTGALAGTFHYRAPVALIWELMAGWAFNATGLGRTLTGVLNEVATPLVAPIADGGQGSTGEDTSHQVAVAAGDKLAVKSGNSGAASPFLLPRSVLRAADGKAVTPLVVTAGVAGVTFDATARAIPPSGQLSITGSYNTIAHRVRALTTWRGLFAYVPSNSSTGSGVVTIRSRLNDVDTAMLISVGVGETGYFLDNANSVTVADGDYIHYRKTGGVGAAAACSTVGSSLVADDRKSELYGHGVRSYSPANFPIYRPLAGGDPSTGNDLAGLPAREFTLGFPARISQLRVNASVTLDASIDSVLLVNGMEQTLTCQHAAGAGTGAWAEDMVNAVVVGGDDRVALLHKQTGATTGAFVSNSVAVLIEDLTPSWRAATSWSA